MGWFAGRWGFVAAVVVVGAVAVGGGLLVGQRTAEPDPADASASGDESASTEEASPHAHDDTEPHAHDGTEPQADRDVDLPWPHAGHAHDPIDVPPQSEVGELPVRGERTERLEPEMDGDTKVFELTAEPIRWELNTGRWVTAWAYNGQIPGPEIWVDEGDRIRVEFTNELPQPTTIHWHGVDVPNEMDGVPGVTQDPIQPVETFTYEFEAKPSGTFWYHPHFDEGRQLDMGLSGALVVRGAEEPDYDREYVQLLDEWIRLPDGRNGWEGVAHAGHNTSDYNWFTINGKSFPETEPMVVSEGDRVRLRIINSGAQAHPMHLHGRRMTVVAKDGAELPQPYEADTVTVAAGERFDVEFTADRPGDWMFHCHIPQHMENDGNNPGGLMSFVTYEGHETSYQQEHDGGE